MGVGLGGLTASSQLRQVGTHAAVNLDLEVKKVNSIRKLWAIVQGKGHFFHLIRFPFDPHQPLICPDRLNDFDSSSRLRQHMS